MKIAQPSSTGIPSSIIGNNPMFKEAVEGTGFSSDSLLIRMWLDKYLPQLNLHVFDQLPAGSSSSSSALPRELMALQDTLGRLWTGPLNSPETTFFSCIETEVMKDVRVSSPLMVQYIKASGDASAWHTHLSVSPIRWHVDLERISGGSKEMEWQCCKYNKWPTWTSLTFWDFLN